MTTDHCGRLIPDVPQQPMGGVGYCPQHNAHGTCPWCQPPQHFIIGSPPSCAPIPSIAEQMGTDQISKLAVALHDLADAIRSRTEEPTP